VIKDTPHEVRVRYCNIDYDREIAIVPEVVQNGKRRLLGVGRLSIEPDGKSGEFAIIVTDEFQNCGLGTKLTDHVLDVAEDMGVERVYSVMLGENYRAISLMKRMGFSLAYSDDGTVEATLDLRGGRAPESASRSEVERPPEDVEAHRPSSPVPVVEKSRPPTEGVSAASSRPATRAG
jgi:N-acetylglutamate synthase-like GNAT family acetyltransferase